ncbi:glycosyltransferase family 4 protein [Pseudidiomarina insulisalsae]|uniref:Glycosyltransferase WbuB n=1 Tax=Pseudidiomarina insulisalsae TaxID=575789 RepID=A0A432YNW8_9GAMM|nr:glycosyltransferase family 4 protein [Pseudidiomarina insulisalsae]RUO62646.1 glycosyltransferase WbuB [Pseudidiomarina insulisalsae]
MKKRIIFLSQLFDPEYSIKGLALCKHLNNLGYEVEVVTTFPSYPKGKVFDGYRSRLKNTDCEGAIKVTRLWSYITGSKGKLSRALNYFSFFITSLSYLLFCKKADVIYAYHPQITTGVSASFIKRIRRTPFISDIQDLWPESLIAEGASAGSKASRVIRRMVNFSLKNASKVVVLSNGFKTYLVEQGTPEDKISVIYNWCPEERRYLEMTLKSSSQHDGEPKVFLYTGNHGPLQSLESVIKAFASVPKELAKFVLVGQGAEKSQLKALAAELNIENVIFKDFVAPDMLVGLVRDADVMVCHLKNDPLFDITIPSKVQAYLCSGKPILIATGREANELVRRAKAGLSAEPENAESIASAIRRFAEMSDNELYQMGRSGQEFYQSELRQSSGFKSVTRVIEECL